MMITPQTAHITQNYKVAGHFDPEGPATMACAKRFCNQMFVCMLKYTIVNERQNRACVAEMLNFSIVNELPNAACATEMLSQ